MPAVTPRMRKPLIRAAIVAVCSSGIAATWYWYPSELSTYAILIAVILLALVMKQAARWGVFQVHSQSFLLGRQVNGAWDFRIIAVGILCYPLAIAGGTAALIFAIDHNLVASLPAALAVLAPFLALMFFGFRLIGRGISGRGK